MIRPGILSESPEITISVIYVVERVKLKEKAINAGIPKTSCQKSNDSHRNM